MSELFSLRPQAPGGARPRSLAFSHKLGRPAGPRLAAPRVLSPASGAAPMSVGWVFLSYTPPAV